MYAYLLCIVGLLKFNKFTDYGWIDLNKINTKLINSPLLICARDSRRIAFKTTVDQHLLSVKSRRPQRKQNDLSISW